MTSPVVLEKGDKIITAGLAIDPFSSVEPFSIYSVQPVVSFRAGLGKKSEIGVSLYGPFYPGLVVDYKHNFLQKNNFHFSGDLAVFGGYYRPVGVDYSLLFGNQQLYGVFGAWCPLVFSENKIPYMKYGLGSELIADTGFGLEFNLTHIANSGIKEGFGFYDPNWYACLGIKWDFTSKNNGSRKKID